MDRERKSCSSSLPRSIDLNSDCLSAVATYNRLVPQAAVEVVYLRHLTHTPLQKHDVAFSNELFFVTQCDTMP